MHENFTVNHVKTFLIIPLSTPGSAAWPLLDSLFKYVDTENISKLQLPLKGLGLGLTSRQWDIYAS